MAIQYDRLEVNNLNLDKMCIFRAEIGELRNDEYKWRIITKSTLAISTICTYVQFSSSQFPLLGFAVIFLSFIKPTDI